MIADLKQKNQVTIPKDQEWYYSPEWQQKEKDVDQQIEEGEIFSADDAEDLFKQLELDKL